MKIPSWLSGVLGKLRRFLNSLNAAGVIPSQEHGPDIEPK